MLLLTVLEVPRLYRHFILLAALSGLLSAATPDRITRPVNPNRTQILRGHVHRLAQPQFDQGSVDAGMRLDDVILLYQPSSSQQAELDALLADQQNPSSPRFHQWLTPEDFADRFGLTAGDHSKVVAWLHSQGLTVNRTARGRNWVSFSGSAEQVSQAFHTPIHRFRLNGETHFAVTREPSVPEALAGVTGGFIGLHDFHPKSMAHEAKPDFTTGGSHFMSPDDFRTIYNIAPLIKAGFDGSGQNIVVVGQSNILLSDIRSFRKQFGLPANDPKITLYSSTDPGFTGDQIEGNLDLEWAGAIAPEAKITYVYGPGAFNAIISAVDFNFAPVISNSYALCEIDEPVSTYRSIAQQANAQGITILSASGDSGAAACDSQGSGPQATHGIAVNFPPALPEVTAVGGTQFVEGKDTYWSTSNSSTLGSALSYIPETAWNETATGGLLSTGGGPSAYYPRPSWQTGPGLPDDQARHVPDVAFSAAGHDAYLLTLQGQLTSVFGTSASTPAMAGLVAILNQYQVASGFQKQAGLGNINPQLYRLAQSSPAVFHDVITGDNMVPCAQGTPNCLTGNFGFSSAQGYDMTTGLGSVDGNNLVTQWNTATKDVAVVLSTSTSKATPNDTIALTAGVYPVNGGIPTGSVTFSSGTIPLGTVQLITRNNQQVADLYFPAYLLQGTGIFTLTAEYSGDAAYSTGGVTKTLQVTATPGTSAIVPSWPNTVWPNPGAQGLTWATTFTLREVAGFPALITGFSIDGVAQPINTCFASPNIPAAGTVTCNLLFRNLSPPVQRTFGIAGVDAAGQTWSRQFTVTYNPLPPSSFFNLTATPLIVNQDLSGDPSCQWPARLRLDDLGGSLTVINTLRVGNVDMASRAASIFGTDRLAAFGSLQGTLCFSDITPPATEVILVGMSSGFAREINISFAGPASNPAKLSASPTNVNMSATSKTATSTVSVGITDKTQPWTASIFPANSTTAWLTLSQYSGTGPAQITVTASTTGFEPGAYGATIIIESQNAAPQHLDVPVMFVVSPSTAGTSVTSVVNPASYRGVASPGMSLAVFGTKLADSTATSTGNPLPLSVGGVSATINGQPAPIVYASPGQLNIQVPYATGAGPAVLGINNHGQIAGFSFDVTPAAPAIFADANGDVTPGSTVKHGSAATLFMTGLGEVSPALKTFYTPTTAPAAGNYKPVLPLSITVGGINAFVQSANLAANQFGIFQVSFIVPASVPNGRQPVVVTVGGVASPPVNIIVQ